jgi:rod shape-determining protein MreC
MVDSGWHTRKHHDRILLERIIARKRLVTVFLLFSCLTLMVMSRIENAAIMKARMMIADFTSPVVALLSAPAIYIQKTAKKAPSYIDYAEEMEHLQLENSHLKQWELRATQLEDEIARLRKLLKAAKAQPLRFATAKVIVDPYGPFSRSAIINIGKSDGIKKGYAVISSRGMVGRITEVAENNSRILLLDDMNSKIPVFVGKKRVQAVMKGRKDGELVLKLMSYSHSVRDASEIYTSGQGGLLPKGLHIGKLSKQGRDLKVVDYAKLDNLDYVSVLFLDTPGVAAINRGDSDTSGKLARAYLRTGGVGIK